MPTSGHRLNIERYDDQYVVTIDGSRRQVCDDIQSVVALVDAVLRGTEPQGPAEPVRNGHTPDGHG